MWAGPWLNATSNGSRYRLESKGEMGEPWGNAFPEGFQFGSVPVGAAEPAFDEVREGARGGAFGYAAQQFGVVDAIKERLHVGVNDVAHAAIAQLDDASDGGVDAAAGTVGVAGFQELLLGHWKGE